MAGPTKTQAPESTARSTRQLLDELDVLMERMLTLPVEDDRTPVVSPPPSPTEKSAAVAVTLTMIEDEAPVAQHRPAAASPIYNDTIRPEVPAYRVEIASDASLARGLFDLPNDHHPESPPVENEPSNPPQPVREVSPLIADNSDLAPTQEHILTWIEAAAPPEAQPKPRKQKPPTEPRPLPSSESPNWSSPAIAPTGPWKSSRASWSYVTLLRWERHYARATRRFGLLGRLFRTGLVRSLLGLLGLAMMLASAAWLLKDWLHWPS